MKQPFWTASIFPVRITILLTMILLFFGVAVCPGEEGDFSGSWKSDLTLSPGEGRDLIEYTDLLNLRYSWPSFTAESHTVLSNSDGGRGLDKQSFEFFGRLGMFDIASDLVFSPEDVRLDYWLTESSLSFGGATLSNTFLLEYHVFELAPGVGFEDYPGQFGSGMEWSVSGTGFGGAEVEVSSRFGMEVDEYELSGRQSGSGYDITQQGSGGRFTYGPSNLQYVSTTAELYGLSLDCCRFDGEARFSREEGFDYADLDFRINSSALPLYLDTGLRFSPQTKSVPLDPAVEVQRGCFSTYWDLVDDSGAYDLELEGFSLNRVELGRLSFSSVTAIGGDLYKSGGASHLSLRADDYFIDPDDPTLYDRTDYEEVFSLIVNPTDTEIYPNYRFGGDFYFDLDRQDLFVDLALLTLELSVELRPALDIGTGLSVTPEGDLELLLEGDLYF